MSIELPASLEPLVIRFAQARRISHDQALTQLLNAGLEAELEGEKANGFFTEEKLALLDEASQSVREGARTYDMAEVDAFLTEKMKTWPASRQS